jgi:hypothetical protein
VPLFRSHDTKLLEALADGMRLLLPADPGPDRMLDAVRQYNPAARPDGGRLYVDGGTIYLGQAFGIDAKLAGKAGLPADITVAYFMNWLPHRPQFAGEALTDKYQQLKRDVNRDHRAQGSYALGGLAARFGGLAMPQPKEAGEPLHANVYTPRRLGPDDLADLISRYAPRGPVEVEGRSAGSVSQLLMDEELKGSQVMKKIPAQGVLTVHTGQPAEGADAGLARAVGETALALAEGTGGICLDVFGFRVRDPGDLVIR